MIILGIDPGYATTGYGVINKDDKTGKCSLVDYGAIETDKDEAFPTRLAMIQEGMQNLIDHYRPDAVAVEELFFTNNITTGIQVAEARGVIICTAVQKCGKLYEYTPIEIKQAITGTGKAEKHQVMYMTKMLLGLKKDPKPDDAADALAVALTHAQTNNEMKDNSMFVNQKRVYHKEQKKNLGLLQNIADKFGK
ncbi:MAG: crossover junction endodeoxyribonuclease RuvC [Clostridia bacterium]|nr:crossover junction endodeoxyribonuclease RuvC [Clostridia bacterium]